MSKFKLKEATVTVRGESITVRELKQAERVQWVKIGQDDRYRGPGLLVSLGCVDPKFTEEEANELPADVVSKLAEEVMKISGFLASKGAQGEKESNAGGEVPVPSQLGVGDATK